MENFGLDGDKIRVKVLPSSTTPQLGGTSAELLPGEKITVTELLYGMMLPSGNDAAQSLGIYFGNFLLKMDCAQSQQTSALNIDGNVYEEDYQEDEEDIGSPNLKKKVRLNTAGTAQSSNSAATCENS